MKREVRDAIRAGAIGFTTSRTRNHQTPDGNPVASRLANWEEIRQLVGAMGELNAGVFEIAGEDTGLNPARISITWTVSRHWRWIPARRSRSAFSPIARRADYWRNYFKLADETAEAGAACSCRCWPRAAA